MSSKHCFFFFFLRQGCRPMQVWLLSRHGTRYPSRKKIESLKKLQEFKAMITSQSKLCQEDIQAIKDWSFNASSNDHYNLHRQGVEELKSLATRLKRQFPQIFNTPFNDAKFKVSKPYKIQRDLRHSGKM